VVDELREKGERVGLLKVWLWRPFPRKEITEALAGAKAVAIMDRAISFGNLGALYLDVVSGFAGREGPVFVNYIYGLGGRDIPVEHIAQVFEGLKRAETGELRYLGLRE